MVTHHELTNVRKMASFQGERPLPAPPCDFTGFGGHLWGVPGALGQLLTGRLTPGLSYVLRIHVAVRTFSVIVTKCSFIRRYILFLKCDHVKASVFGCLINKAACVSGQGRGPDSQGRNYEEGAAWLEDWGQGGSPQRREGRLRALSLGRASAEASGGRLYSGGDGGLPAG